MNFTDIQIAVTLSQGPVVTYSADCEGDTGPQSIHRAINYLRTLGHLKGYSAEPDLPTRREKALIAKIAFLNEKNDKLIDLNKELELANDMLGASRIEVKRNEIIDAIDLRMDKNLQDDNTSILPRVGDYVKVESFRFIKSKRKFDESRQAPESSESPVAGEVLNKSQLQKIDAKANQRLDAVKPIKAFKAKGVKD